MTKVSMTFEDGRIHVEGFPTAVKLAKLDGDDPERLAHLVLHYRDLTHAHDCTGTLLLPELTVPVIREALWRSAIVAWAKCFGRSDAGRFQLRPAEIYPSPDADRAFRHFKALRNKHIAHDENSYAQAKSAAVIGPENGERKILHVQGYGMFALSENPTDLHNLHALIEDALKWVLAQIDIVVDRITDELESWEYKRLLALPDMSFMPPDVAEVAKRRR